MNSVGVLPVTYLNTPDTYRAEALLANAQQIAAQYFRSAQLRQERALVYRHYTPLSHEEVLESYLQRARELLARGEPMQAEAVIRDVIDMSLKGLKYVQTYDRPFLLTVAALAYLGWMYAAFAILSGAPAPVLHSPVRTYPPPTTLSAVVVCRSHLSLLLCVVCFTD